MLHLTPEQIKEFKDVSLADIAMELRRRIKAQSDPIRDEINSQYDGLIAALQHTSSGHLDHRHTTRQSNI